MNGIKRQIRIRIYNIYAYIIAFTMILECWSVWKTIPEYTAIYSYILPILMAVGILGFIYHNRRWRQEKKTIISVLAAAVYLIIYMLLNMNNVRAYIQFCFVILFLILLFCSSQAKDIMKILIAYQNCILVLLCMSLFFWLFGSIMHILGPTGVTQTTWSGTAKYKTISTYFNIYYETQTISGTNHMIRNSGFFCEAPIASLHYSIALLIEMLLKKKASSKRMFLFGVGIISTVSVTGILLLGGLMLYRLYANRGKSRFVKIIMVFVAIMITIPVIYFGYSLFELKINNGSGVARLDDFRVGFQAWMDHPFLGGGFNLLDYLRKYMGMWRNINQGFSNSIMYILATGGIYLFTPYAILMIIAIKNIIVQRNIKLLIFFLGFLYMFIITIIAYQYLTAFIFAWFAVCKKKTYL